MFQLYQHYINICIFVSRQDFKGVCTYIEINDIQFIKIILKVILLNQYMYIHILPSFQGDININGFNKITNTLI